MNDDRALGPAALLVVSAALLVAAPTFVPGSYSVIEHTTSESAGQLVKGSWVARCGFVTLGFAVLWLLLSRSRDRRWGVPGTFAHGVFAVSMVATAVFAARSWQESAPYDPTEDLLHSVASFGVGAGFIVGVLLVGSHRGRETGHARWGDVAAPLAVVAFLLAMGLVPDFEGVFQRTMFLVAYLWYGTEALAPTVAFRPVPADEKGAGGDLGSP